LPIKILLSTEDLRFNMTLDSRISVDKLFIFDKNPAKW